jgi:hypothetical protein
MFYKVVKSFDDKDLNKVLMMDTLPNIGGIIRLRDGRKFKLLDIECVEIDEGFGVKRFKIRGCLERLS